MNKPIKIGLAALASGIVLAACHSDDSSAPPTPPPSSSATSFEGLAFSLVEDSTCNTTTPTDINDTDFAFNPDQDTADPRGLTSITTACTS
jgi:hypothetical protein